MLNLKIIEKARLLVFVFALIFQISNKNRNNSPLSFMPESNFKISHQLKLLRAKILHGFQNARFQL